MSRALKLLLAFAIVNAVLYSVALPLWEGFDEPFHYGYVQSLSIGYEIPVFGRARISSEIKRSLTLVPLSWLFSEAIPGSISFQAWTHLGATQKQQREKDLEHLGPDLKRQPSDVLNYEAQQAPLAYFVLAPISGVLEHFSLRPRILVLRLICSIIAALLLFFAVRRLPGASDAFRLALLACVFESEMLWASVAHVGNDWLAIPLTVWFLAALKPARGAGGSLELALLFSAGLLTKAYFLAFTPIFAANILYRRTKAAIMLLIPVVVAGPWYAHNVLLYGSLSGTQQSVAGIGFRQVLGAIPKINWITAATEFVRWSLWTGNWSFTSFSRVTIDIEALLLVAAFALYLVHYRRMMKADIWVLAACACFLLGLVYQTGATWIHTNGASTHPEPWYAEGVVIAIWGFCFSGLQAMQSLVGRGIAIALCLLSAWIAELTYVAKLLPYYGGFDAKANGHNLIAWWLANPTESLRGVTLGPVWAVYALVLVFSVLLAALSAVTIYRLTTD